MSELDEAGYHAARKAMIDNGGGKSSPQALRNALCAYLDITAPSRAPDGGVTLSVENDGFGDYYVAINGKWTCEYADLNLDADSLQELFDRLNPRLAASRAGDREQLNTTQPLAWLRLRNKIGDAPVITSIKPLERQVAQWTPLYALAPAAGQDDAGEVERG